FFFGVFFVFGDVGMVFAREFAEGFANVVGAGGAGHAKSFVIIFELNSHGRLSNCLSKLIGAGWKSTLQSQGSVSGDDVGVASSLRPSPPEEEREETRASERAYGFSFSN